MAKGCMHYRVEFDAKDDRGWYCGSRGAFRDTPSNAHLYYEKCVKETPAHYSVRLVECKVIKQKNGVR